MSSAAAIHRKAIELGQHAVRMTALAGAGHPTSALSLAHIVTQLLYQEMRFDPAQPHLAHADRLVLSEGHAVPIAYAAYADLGGVVWAGPTGARAARPLTIAELDQLRARDSVLDGHPNPAEGVPMFDAATGSLGMGLSVAAGLGLAARLDQSPRRIFCIVGDGEAREGQIWEALDFIRDQQLDNITVLFNCNGQGQAGYVSAQQSPERLAAKLAAFDWHVEIIDGHDPAQLAPALRRGPAGGKPPAIVARTVKGWGCAPLLQGNWHGKPPTAAELPACLDSLEKAAGAQVAAAEPLAFVGRARLAEIGPGAVQATPRPDPRSVAWPGFREGLEAAGLGAALAKNAVATRRAYGAALKIAGDLLPQVCALDGDVSNSTFSEMFAKAHPRRFFECKIAEQNMISAAVGLAAAGYVPFANSFAKFLARGYDQVELASISRANIKLVGSHSGITPCSDGPSQMALSDVAYFRSFTTARGDDRVSPLGWIFMPADAICAWHCTRLMIETPGLCYMRTYRPDVPLLYPPDAQFEPGGFSVLQTGEDLALVSCGYMVHVALQAAALLAKQNIRAAVIDAYSLPIAPARTAELTGALARSGKLAVVLEDNYGGGLGAALAELAANPFAAQRGIRVEPVTVNRIPKSTRQPDEVLDLCGVSAAQAADRAMAALRAG